MLVVQVLAGLGAVLLVPFVVGGLFLSMTER
jgi:hypothetical protein